MQSTPARLALLAALAAAAVVLFIVLNNSGDSGSSDTQTSSTAAGTPQVIDVKDGAPVGGVQKIEVNKGDQVNLEVRLDRPEEAVHVHGYEIEKSAATSPVRLSFPANLDGVYEVEVHGEGGSGDFQIAELTVNP